ncbi:MAG TPA: MbnP family protein [Polyangiaceae bacterium]|nr:MbnP family protein [Polyangiaceae bacterium]
MSSCVRYRWILSFWALGCSLSEEPESVANAKRDATQSEAAENDAAAEAANDEPCPERPASALPTGVLEMAVEVYVNGKPLRMAESNELFGQRFIPSNLRFYISDVSLDGADSRGVRAELVGKTGQAEPYGTHFVNADDAPSLALTLRAPPGTYRGMSFNWGLSDACNARSTKGLKAPLSTDSQMAWPHLVGFLFLRYEGRVEDPEAGLPDGGTMILPAIHMGGLIGRISAPVVHAKGALVVPAQGGGRAKLRLVMDEVFRGATADMPPSDDFIGPPLPEAYAGERLRQTAPDRPVFEVVP